MSKPNRLVAILAQRCPVCLVGPVFNSMFGAHKNCPHCGVRYERETGFYLNAMFVAYAMALVILAPSFLILYLRGVSTFWFSVIMGAEVLLMWPLVFRYSRIIWMHLDQLFDPRQPPTPTQDTVQPQ
jgi:uncharacterized protein (DUF983 family)